MKFQFYVGGIPNKQEGIVVTQNFTGCVENLYLNSSNIIKEMKEAHYYGEGRRFELVNTLYSCVESPVIPVTFLTQNSFVKLKGYEGMSAMNSSFAFRTYEETGLMLYHAFQTSGYVAVSKPWKIEVLHVIYTYFL